MTTPIFSQIHESYKSERDELLKEYWNYRPKGIVEYFPGDQESFDLGFKVAGNKAIAIITRLEEEKRVLVEALKEISETLEGK